MKEVSQALAQLVKEACEYPPQSSQRQKKLTQIIRIVNCQLWSENTAYYEDALQETWFYFCQNVCEANTAKAYDADKASVVTWLNSYLKWRLKDGYISTIKQRQRTAPARVDEQNKIIDPIDRLPAKPDIPPILAETKAWATRDRDRQLRQTYLEHCPQISAQLLILARLPPETPWKHLAAQYDVPVGTLSSFYQRKCKPLLREFSKSQGYI